MTNETVVTVVPRLPDTPSTIGTVYDLFVDRLYEFRVKAVNSEGEGNMSTPLVVKSKVLVRYVVCRVCDLFVALIVVIAIFSLLFLVITIFMC